MSFVRNIVGGGRIASEAAARSVIRRVAWSYITLAAAMFVFEEALRPTSTPPTGQVKPR